MSLRPRLAAALLLGTACLEDNSLGGSMSEVFALDVSRVEVYKNHEGLNVTFLRNRNIYLDVVASVTVALRVPDGGTNGTDGGVFRSLQPGTKIDLQGEYATGHPIVSVVHAPGGEPSRLLPPVQRGDLHIAEGGEVGQVTAGDFSMVFKDKGGDIGFGRTLSGRFRAFTQDAGFGELP